MVDKQAPLLFYPSFIIMVFSIRVCVYVTSLVLVATPSPLLTCNTNIGGGGDDAMRFESKGCMASLRDGY